MKTVPIAFAFDSRMETPAGVCLYSLLNNASEDTFYDIFVLHHNDDDFSNSKILSLQEQYHNCRITFRTVGDVFDNTFEIRGITKATYFKLLIPKLIPEYDKILYSDIDVIFREDLSKYIDIELGDNYFAGVNSVPVMNDDYSSYIKSIGLTPEEGYYYGGNLLFNSRVLRENGIVEKMMDHINKQYRFQDMDIINLTCRGKIKHIPISFCLTVNYYDAIMEERDRLKQYYTDDEMNEALKNGIVHFNGAKPWNEVCFNMDIWWDYYRRSIFFDEKFAHDFWFDQTYRIEKMSLWKRVKQVARYFREGGRK